MERIDFHGGFFAVPSKPQDKKESLRTSKTKKNFMSVIRSQTEAEASQEALSIENEESDLELEELLDLVHELGEKLKDDPTLNTVQDYKRAVKKFLKIVVRRCYLVEERTSTKDVLNQKKFTQIRVIDQKIERLAAGVMTAQRDQIEILRRVDELYGALVNLLQ
jgi:hypothetical protein